MSIPDSAVGSLGAALIAATIAFLGLIVGKENKISEFRQAWIDGLRIELSKFLSLGSAIYRKVEKLHKDIKKNPRTKSQAIYDKSYGEIDILLIEYYELQTKIKLRLNPNESSAKDILEKVSKIDNMFDGIEDVDLKELDNFNKEIENSAQTYLKMEWNRVKEGECTYQIAKWISGIFLICAIIWTIDVLSKVS